MRYSRYRFPSPLMLLKGQQRRVFSASLIILTSLLLSRVLGIVRDRLFTTYFFGGLEWQLDVYYAAFRIPDTLYQLVISSVLAAGFLPTFSQKLVKESKTKALNFALITLFTLLGLLSLSILILYPFWGWLITILVPGFSYPQQQLFLQIIPFILLAQLILSISNLSVLILQTHNHFVAPALSPLMYNLGIIFGIILLSPHLHAVGLAYGVLLGSLGHVLIQLPVLTKLIDNKINLKLITFSQLKADLSVLAKLSLPNVASVIFIQTELNWLTRLTSLLSSGSLSIFNFASNLIQLPISIFSLALGQAIFPKLALSNQRLDNRKFSYLFEQAINQTLFLVTPLIILFIVLRLPLVRLVLGSHNFSWENTVTTARLVQIMIPIILAQSLNVTFQKIFLALGQSRFILIAQLVSTTAFITATGWLNFAGKQNLYSLAIILSIAALLKFLLGGFLLIKENKLLWQVVKRSYKILVKIIFIGIVVLFISWFSYRIGNLLFNTAYTISLFYLILFVSLATISSYLILGFIFQLEPLFAFVYQIKRSLPSWLLLKGRQS